MDRLDFLSSIAKLENVQNNFPAVYFAAKSLSGTVSKMDRVTTRQIERLSHLRFIGKVTRVEDFRGPINPWANELRKLEFY